MKLLNRQHDSVKLLPSGGSRQRQERILLPFTSQAISRRAFQAAIRLAHAEGATVVPAFLARVPRTLPRTP